MHHGRSGVAATLEQPVLEVVGLVEGDQRQVGPAQPAAAPVTLEERGAGRGQLTQGAEPLHRAALNRGRLGGDGREHRARSQEVRGASLVLHANRQRDTVSLLPTRQRRDAKGPAESFAGLHRCARTVVA